MKKIYLIGDVQACYRELVELLELMGPGEKDQVWFCGDLVGRGPEPLSVMRLVTRMPNAHCVLGNHDLHLLAIAGGVRANNESLRLSSLLKSSQRTDFLEWIRFRPLVLGYRDILLAHASIHPDWNELKAGRLARTVEKLLRSKNYLGPLQGMYGNEPTLWLDSLRGEPRYCLLLNIFTRARYYYPDRRLNLNRDNSPVDGENNDPSIPWYEIKNHRDPQNLLFFGHWSSLTHYNIDPRFGVYHLDKGCVWGGSLHGVEVSWQKIQRKTSESEGARGSSRHSKKERKIKTFTVPSQQAQHNF